MTLKCRQCWYHMKPEDEEFKIRGVEEVFCSKGCIDVFTSLNQIGDRPTSPSQTKEECQGCRFSAAIKYEPGILERYRASYSKCRFNPPASDTIATDMWPVVSKDAWCGKWEAKK